MKKIFTIMAALLLVSTGAFAQKRWTNLVVNGSMEGEQDPTWSSFWCHDWRRGVEFDPATGQQYDGGDTEIGQFQGFAEIVEDPANPNNHCARVIIRTEEQADETGNKIKPDGSSSLASWDSQFFIYANEVIPSGKLVKMTLKVKGEKAGSFETQAHWAPGDYNHYQLFGNINYTTEWTTVEVEATVSTSHTQEENGKFFQSVAFNLSTMTDGNTVYFDDVRLEVKDQEEAHELEGWFNFLRKGTLSDDKIGDFTNFTGRDGADGRDLPARVVNDPLDGQPALNVTGVYYNATMEVKSTDEEGNETITVEQICIKENGDTIKNNNGSVINGIDDWATQFFVTIPHKFVTNQHYKVVFSARADKPAQIQSQIHRNPGDYLHYEMLGNFDLTEEWQTFEFEDNTISSSQNGGYTIAFNCNVKKDEIVNYYFRFDEFCANSADVKDEERVLASETIKLPVPAVDKDVNAEVDMTTAVETLSIDNLLAFANDNTMKVKKEEGYTEGLQATTGVFLDENGLYTEEENGIILTLDEDNTVGNKAVFNVANVGVEWAADKTADTKILFEEEGWCYLYNITFVSEEAYSQYLGVSSMSVDKKNSGVIYDLTGRKVAKAGKGLYIMDGKKFISK
jgi:hypothetical protein